MSDQLAESSKELEMELREELDMALGAARDAQRQRDAALETLSDREMTITKFRELTQKLQEQCLDLQNRLQSSDSTRTVAKGESNRVEVLKQ
jgi:dynactin 1